jgi:hypothetical protein
MNDDHSYEEDGIKWIRIFTSPNSSKDTRINANDSRDFIEKTKQKNYSIGEMWDISKGLSEQREKRDGIDKVKEKTISNYEKKTKKKHPSKTNKNNILI